MHEGDIDIGDEELAALNDTHSSYDDDGPMMMRSAIRNRDCRWKDNMVPYTISMAFTSRERTVIAKAIKAYHDNTCLRLVHDETSEMA